MYIIVEVQRVLKPSGRFIFMEHVAAPGYFSYLFFNKFGNNNIEFFKILNVKSVWLIFLCFNMFQMAHSWGFGRSY